MSRPAIAPAGGALPGLPAAATVSTTGVLAAIAVGSYMSALDSSIVNTVLPLLTQAFKTNLAAIEWVVTVYLLVQSGLLLTFGRLGDMRGHKRLYTAGFFVFILSSAACGLAPAVSVLVAARAVQAVGASLLIATAPAILTRAFDARQRGKALGFYATAVYLGVATGPPLGGWLASLLSWRAVFYINVPVCLVAIVLTLRYVPADAPAPHPERFDLFGAATYVLGLVALLLALDQGPEWGWLSPRILGSLAAGVVLLGVFAAAEVRVPSPMLDLGLFRRRLFTAPVLSAVMNYMGVSATGFMVPFLLIQGRGLSPARAGLVITAQPIIMAATASISGSLSDRVGTRLLATAGMSLLAAALFLLSRIGGTAPIGYVVGTMAAVGLGIGLFTSPNNSAVMGAVPQHRRGVASGVLATARTLGNVLGIGMAGAVFAAGLSGSGLGGAPAVVAGVRLAILAASGVALLGAITSALREPEPRPAKVAPPLVPAARK